MAVVSNTSPLSNLAILGRLDLLREQFDEIIIPTAVEAELKRMPHVGALTRLKRAYEEKWVRVQPLTG